jgi:hypothetical protein
LAPNAFERRFAVDVTDADAVAFRTQDEILADVDTASYVTRDEAPAPKGYGMTSTEMRRQWMQNTRLRYADALRDALRRHRGLSAQRANEFPALRSEAQFARSVAARWRFVDELERHGVRQPDADTVQDVKTALGGTFERAYETLAERRHAAEQGQLDRYRHEFGLSGLGSRASARRPPFLLTFRFGEESGGLRPVGVFSTV